MANKPSKQKYNVFISYAKKDYKTSKGAVKKNSVVYKLKEALDQNNISYWIDEQGLSGGEEFIKSLPYRIKQADVFLFVSTKNSNASQWTLSEIRTAKKHKKFIIPMIVEDAEYSEPIEFLLGNLNGIKYYDANPEEALEKVTTSILEYLEDPFMEKNEKYGFQNKLIGCLSIISKNIKDESTATGKAIGDLRQETIGAIEKMHGSVREEVDILHDSASCLKEMDWRLEDLKGAFFRLEQKQAENNEIARRTNELLETIVEELIKHAPPTKEKGSVEIYLLIGAVNKYRKSVDELLNQVMANTVKKLKVYSTRKSYKINLSVLTFCGEVKWQYDRPVAVSEYLWKDITPSSECSSQNIFEELKSRMIFDRPTSVPLIVMMTDGDNCTQFGKDFEQSFGTTPKPLNKLCYVLNEQRGLDKVLDSFSNTERETRLIQYSDFLTLDKTVTNDITSIIESYYK